MSFLTLPAENIEHGKDTATGRAFREVFPTAALAAPPARAVGTAGDFRRTRQGRPSKFFIPSTNRRILQYRREKLDGTRRTNGAMKLKKLTARHIIMVNMHLAGMSMEEIATQMRCTLSTVWRVVTDPLAKEIIRNVYETRQMEVDSLLGEMTGVIRETARTGTTKEKLQAVSVYAKLKQTVAGETNPAKTAEDVASAIVAQAKNIQMNFYQNGE